mgnify:CR=1 FL=1
MQYFEEERYRMVSMHLGGWVWGYNWVDLDLMFEIDKLVIVKFVIIIYIDFPDDQKL